MAKELQTTEMQGLREMKVKLSVYLHPSRASNVPQGVREILNSLLLRYNEHFEGSVLAHLDTKIQGNTGSILEGLSPYFCVRLRTTLLLFSPKAGMIGGGNLSLRNVQLVACLGAEGKVNKIEKDYLGVVVLGLFNAAIGVSDIREDLYYEKKGGTRAWFSESDSRHCVKIGSIIRFSVKSVQENEEIVDLCGTLQGPHTGCVKWLAGDAEPIDTHKLGDSCNRLDGNGDKKSKQNRVKKEKVKAEVSEATNEVTPKKKKKKKDANETEGDSSHKKRRKSDVSNLVL